MDHARVENEEYRVLVEDNFHHMDGEHKPYEHGLYRSCEGAIDECKRIVDEFLTAEYKAEMPSEQLWKLYTVFGDDAFIVTADAGCSFSSWEYARQRCKELCGEGTGADG